MQNKLFNLLIFSLSLFSLISCSTDANDYEYSPKNQHQSRLSPAPSNPQSEVKSLKQDSPLSTWDKVSHVPLQKLEYIAQSSDPAMNGWAQLAIISKRYSTHSSDLAQQLMSWRTQFPNHPGNILFPNDGELRSLTTVEPPSHIALLLPLQEKTGQEVRDGFLNAYYESLAKTHFQQTISFYDTNQNKNVDLLYQKAIAEGANVVVGPLLKNEVSMLTRLGKFSVPTLALNYTDLPFGTLPANLYQFGLSPLDEAQQIAEKAASANKSHAIIIAPQNEWGQRSSQALIQRWQSLGKTIVDRYYFSPHANLNQDIAQLMHINTKEDREKMKTDNNKTTLGQQRRQDFDVIFLLAQTQSAREIVPILKFYYANNVPIYATSSINAKRSAIKDNDLRGVIYCDIPWVVRKNHSDRLFAVGHDAYLLSVELPRLTTLTYFPIYAHTGALSMSATQQIYRRLPWKKINAS